MPFMKPTRVQNKLFQNASLLMCYCSIETGQFQTLKTQSERHAIELLFKVQISPDQPTNNTNERDILLPYPFLGTLQCFQWNFPFKLFAIFLQNKSEFLSDNLVPYSLKISKQITDKKNRCHGRQKVLERTKIYY